MKIKRVLQGTALTALAAAAWMGAGSTDASAAIKSSTLTTSPDDDSYQLNVIADNTDIEIMAAVVKPNKNGGVKITAWDVYEGNIASIDVSKLNVTKDSYIALKTDSMSKPKFVGIAAAAKKTKVTFNAGKAQIEKIETTAEYTGNIEYRTTTGKWTTMSKNKDLSGYQYQGATLYLRIPAASGGETAIKELTDITINKESTDKEKVQQLGTLPAKEVKLNIAKQANGPKVALNYVKGTVTIPKGAECRLVANNTTNAALGTTIDASSKAFATTPGAILGNADKGVLEVRKAAVTEKKGKAASKWTRVALNKAVAFSGGTTATVTTGEAVVGAVSSASVKLNYTKNKKDEYAGGLVIDAKDVKFDIDYVIGDVPADGKGIKTIKAGKKVTLKKLSDNNVIRVRVAGNKKNQIWPEEWGVLYTVKLPK